MQHRAVRRILLSSAVAALASAGVLSAGSVPATAAGVRISPADATQPVATCSSTPFSADPSHGVFYRIPAIVRTNAGSLLAFAERRGSSTSASDTGTAQIVEARSTDAGCTWSVPAVVASNGADTVGNPAPVVDASTGRVLLFSIDRPLGGSSFHGLHMQASTDDGVHFTRYSDSALDLASDPAVRPDWKGGLTGPGHALQLTSGPHAGRIVVPIGFWDGRFGADDIVSDDHGATWRVGYSQAGDDGRMEGTVAQLPSGDLWISYHSHDSGVALGKGRIVGLSSDGGTRLTTAFQTLRLPVISVEASSLVVHGGPFDGELLLSSPGRPDVSRRQLMTIFVAHGVSAANPSGSYWSRYPVGLDDTPASYSDLVQLDDQTVGVLYETGHESWHERIAFQSVRIAALTAGATVSARASVVAPKVVWHGHAVIVAKVAVPGTSSPAGSLTVTLTKGRFSRSVQLPLFGDGSSKRVAVVSGLAKGTYQVRVRYNGTPRIKPAVSSATTLMVK